MPFRVLLVSAMLLWTAGQPVSLAATFFSSAPTNLWEETRPYPETMLDKFVPIPHLTQSGCLHRTDYSVYWSWNWRWPVYPQYFLERNHPLRLQLCGDSALLESDS